MSDDRSFDYVIVGGGTAGVIVATRLASDGAAHVCLVEAGPSDADQARVLELARWAELYQSDLDYDYAGERSADNEEIRFSSARVLGGCSSHNNGIAFLPTTDDMRAWRDRGVAGWTIEALGPSIDRLLDRVTIEEQESHDHCTAAFVEAAQEAGYPLRDFWREPLDSGVTWVRFSKRGTMRQSSSVAYLHSQGGPSPTLEVMTDTIAHRLIIDGSSDAVAVQTSRGTLHAAREIVVACGALSSPKLLMLSGIGDPTHLTSVGVRPVVELPAVGQHLKDHPETVAIWESRHSILGGNAPSMLMNSVLFAATSPGPPDLEFHFTAFRGDFYALPKGLRGVESAFSIAPSLTRPHSEGSVMIRDGDPASPPVIDLGLFTDPEGHDARTMIDGLAIARDIARQPSLQSWAGPELAPGEGIESHADLLRYVRATSNASFHVAGSCRMGAIDDDAAVVDPQLQVRGVGRLRVADASIFPEIVLINPALTCMLVGERCAELILKGTHHTPETTARVAASPEPSVRVHPVAD